MGPRIFISMLVVYLLVMGITVVRFKALNNIECLGSTDIYACMYLIFAK